MFDSDQVVNQDPSQDPNQGNGRKTMSLWRVLLLLALFGVLVFAAIKVVAKPPAQSTQREQPAVSEPTPSPTGPALVAEVEGEAYPAPEATATEMPVPTEVIEVPEPTAKPTDAPAPTEIPQPTATDVPAREPVNQDELYAQQLAQLAEEPKSNRGENPAKGVPMMVPANSVALLFAGHANVEINDQVVSVTWQNATENVIVISNASGAPAEFLIKGFPETGYSSWQYRPGVSPEARKLAALSVGNPTHCGLSAGCTQAIVWNVVWDGSTLSYTQEIMKDEFDLTLAAASIPTVDWNSIGANEGLYAMRKMLGQPASTITVNDSSQPVEFGVTAGKDHLLALPAGSKLIAPDGTSQDFAEAATVILTNKESDTVVYTVWLSGPGSIGHQEFRYTFDVTSTVPVLLKAQSEAPRAMSLMAAPAEPTVYIFSFAGSTTVEEKK